MAGFGNIKKGAFHQWLGKSGDAPITGADIQKGLAAGGHAAKMANFAREAKRKFKKVGHRAVRRAVAANRANADLESTGKPTGGAY